MENELILTIDYEIPLVASDLGELLAALGRDYSDLTGGRVLVLSRVESGSLIATLADHALTALPYVKDAVAVAGGIKGIADLAKLLKSLIGKAKSEPFTKLPKRRRKKPGIRSTEAIFKIAADCRGSVRGSYKTSEGEELHFEVTSLEAIGARERARASDETTDTPYANPEPDVARAGEALQAIRPPQAIEASLQKVYQAGETGLSDTELEQIAEVLVSAIEGMGLGYLIDQIASDLQQRGLHRFASTLALRAAQSQRNSEPPITTN